ncbi:MAG TPA: hypothetical protein VFE93_06760 [Myxococcaceae bacterium]|jgi:hypothetical protein|nr:hypothetical protein [Myxococcaceae bacterium]
MEELSLETLARMIAADVLRAHPSIATVGAEAIAHRLETALGTAVRQERLACVGECERRRDLWTGTEERPGTPPSLRAEARFRANEAAVLADALRARSSA